MGPGSRECRLPEQTEAPALFGNKGIFISHTGQVCEWLTSQCVGYETCTRIGSRNWDTHSDLGGDGSDQGLEASDIRKQASGEVRTKLAQHMAACGLWRRRLWVAVTKLFRKIFQFQRVYLKVQLLKY